MFRRLALFSILGCLTLTAYPAQQAQPPSQTAPAQSVSVTALSGVVTDASEAKPQKEDWTKLPVDRTVLKVRLNGLSLGKGDYPDFSREIVRLQWRPGDFIDIYIVTPHGVQNPRVVLYLYSYSSDVDRFLDDGWCKRATSNGLAAVGFVSALTGDRFHGRAMRKWFVPELQEALGSSVHDVQLILDYLGKRNDLSADQVGMWGQGSGASIAILAAAADPRIRALDLLDPWGDWPDWLRTTPLLKEDERASCLTPEFLAGVAMLDPVSYLPQLKDRSLRLQQIMDQTNALPPARDKIAAAVPRDRLVIFKDANAHRESLKVGGVSAWFVAQLPPASQPSVQSAASGPR
jgi:hypothetical protein